MQETVPELRRRCARARRARARGARAAACRAPSSTWAGAAHSVARRSAQGRRSRPRAPSRGRARRGRREAGRSTTRARSRRGARPSRGATRPSRSARSTSRAGRRCCAWSRPRGRRAAARDEAEAATRARAPSSPTRATSSPTCAGRGLDGRKLADARTKLAGHGRAEFAARGATRRARRRRPRASTRAFGGGARRDAEASARAGSRRPPRRPRACALRSPAAARGSGRGGERGSPRPRSAQTDATAAAQRERGELAANDRRSARALARAAETRESKARAAAEALDEKNDALRDELELRSQLERSESVVQLEAELDAAKAGPSSRWADARPPRTRARRRGGRARAGPSRWASVPSATNGNGSRTPSRALRRRAGTSDNAGRKLEKPKKAARVEANLSRCFEERCLVAAAGLSYAAPDRRGARNDDGHAAAPPPRRSGQGVSYRSQTELVNFHTPRTTPSVPATRPWPSGLLALRLWSPRTARRTPVRWRRIIRRSLQVPSGRVGSTPAARWEILLRNQARHTRARRCEAVAIESTASTAHSRSASPLK